MIRLRRAVCWREHARPAQNKLLHRGRPLTRGSKQSLRVEVTAEGGEEVGGLHTSFDVGELVGNSDPAELTSGNLLATRTRPSKGGPCE